jgi:hypothetical protein
MTSSAEERTSASVACFARREIASWYTDSTQSWPLTGLSAPSREENTLKASEETRGCFSLRVLRRTGVNTGNEFAKVGGGCEAKNEDMNCRQDICRVELDVDGGCDRIALDIDIIKPVWLEREPGSTCSKVCRSPKPACRVGVGVLGDLSWFRRVLANAGT